MTLSKNDKSRCPVVLGSHIISFINGNGSAAEERLFRSSDEFETAGFEAGNWNTQKSREIGDKLSDEVKVMFDLWNQRWSLTQLKQSGTMSCTQRQHWIHSAGDYSKQSLDEMSHQKYFRAANFLLPNLIHNCILPGQISPSFWEETGTKKLTDSLDQWLAWRE